MNKVWWIVGVLGAGALAVVGTRVYKQLMLLSDTCVSFTGYKLLNLTKDNVAFTLNFKLKNLSNLGLTINGYDFKVFINNTEVSTVTSANVVELPANGTAQLSTNISFNPADFNQKLFFGILQNFNTSVLRFKGTVAIKTIGISASKLPVDMSSKFTEMLPGAPSTGTSKC